jgi:hypothetical protein
VFQEEGADKPEAAMSAIVKTAAAACLLGLAAGPAAAQKPISGTYGIDDSGTVRGFSDTGGIRGSYAVNPKTRSVNGTVGLSGSTSGYGFSASGIGLGAGSHAGTTSSASGGAAGTAAGAGVSASGMGLGAATHDDAGSSASGGAGGSVSGARKVLKAIGR